MFLKSNNILKKVGGYGNKIIKFNKLRPVLKTKIPPTPAPS